MLGEFSVPLRRCDDPSCQWAHLPDEAHWARHNPPCAQAFIGVDGSRWLCSLPDGHDGAHRGDRL